MEVLASAGLIEITPDTLSSTQPSDVATEKTLTIDNIGTGDLNWIIDEAPSLTSSRSANTAAGHSIRHGYATINPDVDNRALRPN